MKSKSLKWLICTLILWAPSLAVAKYTYEAETLNQVFGTNGGCKTYTADMATQHRTTVLRDWRRYKIYGYNVVFGGETIICAMGGATVDVTNLGESLVGSKIFANNPEAWLAKGVDLYISCVSTSADSMKFDVCELK